MGSWGVHKSRNQGRQITLSKEDLEVTVFSSRRPSAAPSFVVMVKNGDDSAFFHADVQIGPDRVSTLGLSLPKSGRMSYGDLESLGFLNLDDPLGTSGTLKMKPEVLNLEQLDSRRWRATFGPVGIAVDIVQVELGRGLMPVETARFRIGNMVIEGVAGATTLRTFEAAEDFNYSINSRLGLEKLSGFTFNSDRYSVSKTLWRLPERKDREIDLHIGLYQVAGLHGEPLYALVKDWITPLGRGFYVFGVDSDREALREYFPKEAPPAEVQKRNAPSNP